MTQGSAGGGPPGTIGAGSGVWARTIARLHRGDLLPATGAALWAPQLLLALFAGAALLLVYAPTVAGSLLSEEAGTDPLKVTVLAPLATGWLLWHRRERLRGLVADPWWPGLLGVGLAAVLWAIGDLVGVNSVCQFAVVGMLLALVPTVLGPNSLKTLALPVLFLWFCVNPYFLLMKPLMHLDALSGVAALRWTGVPAELNDLTIVTPFGRWQVIEACGGLDYVLIFAMSGVLFASVALQSPVRRVLFVAASILASLFANGLRTWAIIFAVYLRGGVDEDHSMIGWAVFAIVLAMLLLIGRRFSQPAPEPLRVRGRTQSSGDLVGSAKLAMAALAIAAAAPAGVAALERRYLNATGFDGCRVVDRTRVERGGATVIRSRAECTGPSAIAQALVVARATVVSLVPDVVLVTGTRRITSEGSAGPFDAATLTTLGSAAGYRSTYWYEVDHIATGSQVALKWHFALALLNGHDSRVNVVVETETPQTTH